MNKIILFITLFLSSSAFAAELPKPKAPKAKEEPEVALQTLETSEKQIIEANAILEAYLRDPGQALKVLEQKLDAMKKTQVSKLAQLQKAKAEVAQIKKDIKDLKGFLQIIGKKPNAATLGAFEKNYDDRVIPLWKPGERKK